MPAVPEEIIKAEEIKEDYNLVDLIEQPAWKTILFELVKKEKMDPWAIDISLLADKYLEKINSLESLDLRIPANAVLVCAILLHLKAKLLKIPGEEKAKEISEEEIKELEAMLPELKTVRYIREGTITLDELVESIEKILAKTRTKPKGKRFVERIEVKIPSVVKNINERMDSLYKKIEKAADSQGLVMFSQIVDITKPKEVVEAFVPLLFLVNKGKIYAWQERFFGEIFISLVENSAK
ncbi:MAG: segregation/condensation protein A [Candidatus Diapherotrites archaeon]|nr:segregation/condensation protein A [Candidatus Diapherotrites archaeon]